MKTVLMMIMIFAFYNSSRSDVLSQWRGPQRDGKYPDEKLLQSWPENGPMLLWKTGGLGEGYSSPAVTTKAVYVTALIEGKGVLFAFDHNGKPLWNVTYGLEWAKDHPGARSTPTVVDDKIYLVSGMGSVVCISTAGKIVWTVDMTKQFGAINLMWGITESPLVIGDRIYCTPGSPTTMLAALNRQTGETIWQCKGNGELSTYCSPVLVQHNGRSIILTMTQKSVVGVDAETGAFLYSKPHITQYDINPNTPLYHDGQVYVTSGYGTGGEMFQISADGKSLIKLWANKTPDNQMAGVVLLDGFVYSSGHNNRGWACLDWKTGAVAWISREFGGKGPLIFADGKLYLYSEKGDVVLVNPNSQKLEAVSAFSIAEGSGPHWAHPVIKDGRLYIRHGDVLMVFDIAQKRRP
jgi:outer membrane protein assembly factor BamB